MYIVKQLPTQIDADRLDLLVKAEPATIGHTMHIGFMDTGMRGIMPNVRIAGTAITVRQPGPDCTMIHFALGQARPGDILVIDRCGDHRHAATGGAVAYAARCAGIKGIILDGVVSDLGELRQFGVPVWARGSSVVTSKHLDLGGEFCTPISCGGVSVRPGDAILADENGVLVLDPTMIETAANQAICMQADEQDLFARLDRGEKLSDISGASARVRARMVS
jgi:4-hydroxy-4-methyl-2-oxoglutarate aldolase